MEENKKQRIYKSIMLVVITVIITALLTSIVIYKYGANGTGKLNIGGAVVNSNSNDVSKMANSLTSFRKIIDKYYLGEVDDDKLLQNAIKGYIAGLGDEYSEYFTKEEMKEYEAETLGNFIGIGIYMVKDTEHNAVKVLSPIKGSPAYKAGIQPGDLITKVDGKAYTADQLSEVSSAIQGSSDSNVKIEIVRGDQILTFDVKREKIKVNHIESEVLENNIGYLQISTFDEGCYDEFKEKVEELQSKNVKGIIIDLRNNGGGIVDEAINIADMMTDKGATLLITTDKNNKEEITKAKQDKSVKVPVVVLVNSNSASASEILVGALKDNNVAKIVGTKTYGKGVIQQLLSLTDGSGLKITTNEYCTPNRNKINKIGIEPDVEVKLPEGVSVLNVERTKDTQLQKAIELLK